MNVAFTDKVRKTLMSDIFYIFPLFWPKNPGFPGGTEILPGVSLLLGGVKYLVGSFKKKLEKINVAITDKVRKTSFFDIFKIFDRFWPKNTGIRGGTEILPGVRVLLGGVKYFVGSFKKKIRKN